MKVKSSSIKSKHYYKNVEYITDIKGKKLKVIMPIASYDEMLEDLHDLSVIAERKKDSVVSMLKVYNELKKNGFI